MERFMRHAWIAGFLLWLSPTIARSQSDSSRACAPCHREIWQGYRQTGMGRSFSLPTAENVGPLNRGSTYFHAPSDSWFSLFLRDGKYFQRRHQIDSTGKPINLLEKRIDYVMGSGNHARTFLHRTPADTLIELPLGWYAEQGGYWAMNPGYDRPDHEGFRRGITYDCMFCHNAYPSIPAAKATGSRYPSELPMGIDCARCHGDGRRHIETAGAAPILNPARLTPQRQLDLCMSCHLESTSFHLPNAMLRRERGPFSFRPGEPLSDFILNFDHATGSGHENKFEIVSAAYRLRRSACFLKSNDKLLCTTCHNPHRAPRGAEAAAQYNQACLKCHGGKIAAADHSRDADCVQCHMPKRRTEDVIHAVMTDHFIERRPSTAGLIGPIVEKREDYRGRVVPYYPAKLETPLDRLYLAAAQVKQKSNLTVGIAQLTRAIAAQAPARAEWYVDLGDALDSAGRLPEAVRWYREALRREPSAETWLKLGAALRRVGGSAFNRKEALKALNKATELAPENAIAWHELALAHRDLGQMKDAEAALAKALERDPELPEAHNNLGVLRAASSPAAAEASWREAIRIKPDYADAHANLGNLYASMSKPAEADAAFALALRAKPKDAALHYDYAGLLGRERRYDDAQRQLEEALRLAPSYLAARELLADLLGARGKNAEAATHYRAVLRAAPDLESRRRITSKISALGIKP